jgi:hypothetical protein
MSTPRFHNPGMVDREGRLAKVLVDFLESLAGGVTTATATAEAAASAAAPPTTITGDGVSGSPETGYTITSAGTDPLACQIFGG